MKKIKSVEFDDPQTNTLPSSAPLTRGNGELCVPHLFADGSIVFRTRHNHYTEELYLKSYAQRHGEEVPYELWSKQDRKRAAHPEEYQGKLGGWIPARSPFCFPHRLLIDETQPEPRRPKRDLRLLDGCWLLVAAVADVVVVEICCRPAAA